MTIEIKVKSAVNAWEKFRQQEAWKCGPYGPVPTGNSKKG